MHNHNRFKQADAYIASHNFDKIKNYKDFCTKTGEAKKVQLTLSEEDEKYIRSVFLYERKSVAWTQEIGLPHYRIDDNLL